MLRIPELKSGDCVTQSQLGRFCGETTKTTQSLICMVPPASDYVTPSEVLSLFRGLSIGERGLLHLLVFSAMQMDASCQQFYPTLCRHLSTGMKGALQVANSPLIPTSTLSDNGRSRFGRNGIRRTNGTMD